MLRSEKKNFWDRVAVIVNLLAFLPACVLLIMLNSGFGGGTVQYNAYSRAAMDLWGLWLMLYGPFVLTELICLVVAIVIFFISLISCLRDDISGPRNVYMTYALLTVIHCILAFLFIASEIPDA